MKPKKFTKRLALNKKTIADLNSGQLDKVIGGFSPIPCPGSEETCLLTCRTCTCDTCPSDGLRYACCVTLGEQTCIVNCTYQGTICGSQPCC